MPPIAVMAKSIEKVELGVDEVSRETAQYVYPEKTLNFSDEAEQTKESVINASRQIKQGALSHSFLPLSGCIQNLIRKADLYSHEAPEQLKLRWRDLVTATETFDRRINLLYPPSEQDLIKTLWWMAERGQEEDLVLLKQVEIEPVSEEAKRLIEIAEQRISERAYDPKEELRHFFKLNSAEFARLIGLANGHGEATALPHTRQVVEQLRAIKESLQDLVEPEGINRWLRAPHPMFGGKTPIEAMIEGQTERVRQLLSRLEYGIHF